MVFCSQCGTQVPGKFCPECGSPVSSSSQATTQKPSVSTQKSNTASKPVASYGNVCTNCQKPIVGKSYNDEGALFCQRCHDDMEYQIGRALSGAPSPWGGPSFGTYEVGTGKSTSTGNFKKK